MSASVTAQDCCTATDLAPHWIRPARCLSKLSAQFELLAFDYRGMGRSAPVTEPYAMADVAADVAALLDAVGWDTTALAGLSYGGMVAQEFAVTFPDRIDRMALMATSPGGAFASYPLETLADLPPLERGLRSLNLADRRWTRSGSPRTPKMQHWWRPSPQTCPPRRPPIRRRGAFFSCKPARVTMYLIGCTE